MFKADELTSVVVDSTRFTGAVVTVSQVESVQCGQFVEWQYALLLDYHAVSQPSIYVAVARRVFSSKCRAV